ncbi:MAG TPA: DMT family transporter [Candidatus Krumholzibacteria bacterium]|nr:DMT family transporter [Candidatus Krumholzibacteria bacterium]HPD71778.1 DMT family transporter [Candidatus Krumholzibacteria bacterium]HRY41289.1 DMT family transporter [Candidatus Krumholzibacteria bacterium]
MTPAPGPGRIRAGLVAVQLLFGVNYLVSKQIVGALDPAAWAALRAVTALAILAAIAAFGRHPLPRGRDLSYLAGCAVLGITLNQILFLEGLARTTPGHSALICSLIPLFTLASAVALRDERLTGSKVAGLVVGLAGVLVLLEVDRFDPSARYLAGDLLTLGNTASYGLYVALSGRVMRRHDPLGATTAVFLFGAAGNLLYGGVDLLRAPLGGLAAPMWAMMTYAVVGATVVTYFLNLWALKHTHASRVALYIFLQPVVATVLSVTLLAEAVTWRLVVAGALVAVSLGLRQGRRVAGWLSA